ncbi:MAG: amidohydrolase family protein [Verrucomicrobiae bacterium]|nr:amidohydrolase family protein [Verrucomicrobiae bacterium]
MLSQKGVRRAWVGNLDAILHKDIAAANRYLARSCASAGGRLLMPFGTVNPLFPDWEEELRRCAEEHGMRGIRLYPGYHGYGLNDPAFLRLCQIASDRGLIIQIALAMEDERMMHTLLRVEPTDPMPLLGVLQSVKHARVVLLNALRLLRGQELRQLIEIGNVYVEISTLDGVGCVEKLIREIPCGRILFGSNAPMFYFDAAILKLRESALSQSQHADICTRNATLLLS